MKKKQISYEIFRSRALQGLNLKSVRKQFPKMSRMSKDEIEQWVAKQYKKHYK